MLSMFLSSCAAKKIISTDDCCDIFDEFTNKYVCVFSDNMPQFNDSGYFDMIHYLSANLNYLSVENVTFTFHLMFVVDIDGKVIGARIVDKNINDLTDNERNLLKVVESMKPWRPGKCNELNVPFLIQTRLNISPNLK